jgi:AhpD family alkylhydroperoxidase
MNMNYLEHLEHLKVLSDKLCREIPGPMSRFGKLHKEAVSEGVLSVKIKELIALAIAISARCEDCISFHVHDAIKAGASRKEIMEAVGVAIFMGGRPSVICGAEALDALEQYEEKEKHPELLL